MKHNLLSLFALAGAMCMSTSVWAVDPPEEVVPAYTENYVAPEDGGVYFIYNVGATQFLGAGNHWGTHVVTATPEEGVIPVYYWTDAEALSGDASSMNTGMVLPFKLTKTENDTWYIEHMGSNRSDCYLSSEDAVEGVMTNSWIDCGTNRRIDFIITAVDGGYTIQATNTVEAETFFGAVDQEEAPEEGMPYVRDVMNNVTAETGHIVWKFAQTNYVAYNKYNDLLALYEEIVAAEEYGVDATAAISVYENNASTNEDLQLALSALKADVNRAKYLELWGAASEDNPLDVTADCLTNPDFEASNISGWDCTFQGGGVTATNVGFQSGGTNGYTNGDVHIHNFIEAWRSDASPFIIGDGFLRQTVYGLPKGKYVLEADVISCYQWSDAAGKNPTEGVYLYIQAGQYEAKTAVATGDGKPEHFSVTFINDGSDELTFGLKTESATANWIAADNFQIYYYGESDESIALANLNETLKKVENIDLDEIHAEAAVKTAFSDAVAKAQSDIAANAGDDAYEADNTAIVEAQKALETSAKAYEKLEALITKASAMSDEIASQWEDLADEFDTWIEEELEPAYDNGTYSVEDITAAEGKISEMIREFIATPGRVKEGDKLTMLITNADFSNGTAGWTIANRDGGNFGTAFGGVDYAEIECWHGTFDVYQVIPNMPRGAYKLKVQGFSRNDDATQESTVELYAGDITTKFKNINDEYSFEQFITEGDLKDAEITTNEGETAYVPGGMASAQQYFMRENPATGNPFYTNFVDVILAEDGDLRIGVRGNDKHSWVLWDNFELEYAGNNASAYTEQIRTLAGQLAELASVDGAFITAEASKLIDELPAKSEDVIGEADADKCIAFIKELQNAIAYVEEGNAKGAALLKDADIYNSYLKDQISSSYYDFLDLLERIVGYADDATEVADNNAIDAIAASLKSEWGKYVMYDVEATKDAPVTVTEVILNYDYANTLSTGEINSNFWTNEGANGANGGFAEIEFFNTNFKHFQKLEGLKEGYYAVSVEGFYRAGDYAKYTDDSLSIQNAYLFAESALGTNSVGIVNLGTVAQETALGVSGEVELTTLTEGNGWIPNNMEAAMAYIQMELVPNSLVIAVGADGVLTIGVAKENAITNDWTIFSNWSLVYYGAGAENEPDAVRGISDAAAAGIQSIFSINGTQQQGLRRGVNIIRMTDGSVRKVLVK